jgi:predicted MPP superfamily phosphohydrolase
MRAALWDITTPEIHVVLPRLPRALDGFSIALLTDVHIGPLLDGRFLRHLVEQTNALKPDLIAIGGDLIDGSVPQIGHHVAELRHLQSKYGTYFVTGNHEYYAGADQWVDFLRSLGIRVLINSRLAIGDAGASFDLVGLPDFHAGRVGAEEPQIEKAIMGRDPERELIVLAHQPVQIQQAAIAGAGLQLSGHTHGGQLYPFGALTRLVQPYLAGLYRHTGTDTQIYVSRGSGFWGPPMRVLAPAEISLLRLSAG